ncbi:hypothetical protein PIB30_014491 [Stylosanthes scabra]|uniref:Ubiquitin-like protease family profile domain-containing protein n=1 Tax=Stylosanthes scabra TaxID=79078 RepID=A0ABU6X8D7_9FABA|nr:hypothetical protein [Stylosanthes scabra]
MLVPKVEKCVVSSPASMLITDVLMSMKKDAAIEPQHEEKSQPDLSMPSFSLNFDNPTPQADEQPPSKALEVEQEFPLIARTMAVIKSLDEQASSSAPALETPQQTQVEDDDFEERVATWATVPKGGNDYDLIFDLRGPRTLKAMRFQFDSMVPEAYIDIQIRMLEAHHHNWIDKKKGRPHEITTLTNHKEFLSFIDREKIRSHRFSNILSQLLRWAGAPTILKKGSWSLFPQYINVPQQPNEHDCAVFVMKWMELIDPTKLHGCCTYNIEQWTDKKDRGKDNPEQGKQNESRCNKSGKRNVTNKAICCSSYISSFFNP